MSHGVTGETDHKKEARENEGTEAHNAVPGRVYAGCRGG
jgi:hypothetical protein